MNKQSIKLLKEAAYYIKKAEFEKQAAPNWVAAGQLIGRAGRAIGEGAKNGWNLLGRIIKGTTQEAGPVPKAPVKSYNEIGGGYNIHNSKPGSLNEYIAWSRENSPKFSEAPQPGLRLQIGDTEPRYWGNRSDTDSYVNAYDRYWQYMHDLAKDQEYIGDAISELGNSAEAGLRAAYDRLPPNHPFRFHNETELNRLLGNARREMYSNRLENLKRLERDMRARDTSKFKPETLDLYNSNLKSLGREQSILDSIIRKHNTPVDGTNQGPSIFGAYDNMFNGEQPWSK